MIEVRECEEEEVQERRRCGVGDRCSEVLLNRLRVQAYVSRAAWGRVIEKLCGDGCEPTNVEGVQGDRER